MTNKILTPGLTKLVKENQQRLEAEIGRAVEIVDFNPALTPDGLLCLTCITDSGHAFDTWYLLDVNQFGDDARGYFEQQGTPN